MRIAGRSRETGRLHAALDARTSSVVHLLGQRGVGKTALAEHVLADYPGLHYRCRPAPDESQIAALARALGGGDGADGAEAPGSWEAVLTLAAERARPGERGFVLVLDDAYRLGQARSRITPALQKVIERARREDRAFHAVLLSHGGPALAGDGLDVLVADTIEVAPLTLRAAIPRLPGKTPGDFLRAYATFGGVPRVLERLDPSVGWKTNVRRLLLDPGATLAEGARDWIERDVQSPPRYYSILSALSHGESDWASIHRGVPDLTTSGQVAPYLQRLGELGLIATRRSLDAAPTGRSRRYRIRDPFLAFWFRYVLPRLHEPDSDPSAYFDERIEPTFGDHLAGVFAEVCRQFMEHDAIEVFGSNARESGALWGAGYEIDAAGMLGSGAAFYGSCHWDAIPEADAPLARLDEAIRDTRYGFGREHRLRILFAAEPLPHSLEREVARRADAHLVGLEAVVGDDA